METESVSGLTGEQLENVASRVLVLQQYVLRRSWGIYYTLWSFAIAIFLFGSEIPIVRFFPVDDLWIYFLILYVAVGVIAGIATSWTFANAYRTLYLRKALNGGRLGQAPGSGSRTWYLWGWMVVFYVAVTIAFNFFQARALSVLYGLLFVLEGLLLYQLRLAFPGKIPAEGRIALVSFGLVDISSFALSFFFHASIVYDILWSTVIVSWLLCGLYALWNAPDELLEMVD